MKIVNFNSLFGEQFLNGWYYYLTGNALSHKLAICFWSISLQDSKCHGGELVLPENR